MIPNSAVLVPEATVAVTTRLDKETRDKRRDVDKEFLTRVQRKRFLSIILAP